MASAKRVLVYLAEGNRLPQCARFVQSITGALSGCHADQVEVSCSLEGQHFVLSAGEREGASRVLLRRAPFCPFKCLSATEAASLPSDVQARGVDVGVAVLLQTADRKTLLTRRAAPLTIFPNIWVPPGGHVELGEKLLDAGLRELGEETGLWLGPDEFSCRLLGLWESVYPPMLTRGLPQRHHIVTYLLLRSCRTHLQLQARLRPEPQEVSGCVWLDAVLARAIVASVDGADGLGQLPAHLPPTVGVWEVSSAGELFRSTLSTAVLLSRAPAQGGDLERVSTGTKFALELWLDTLGGDEPPAS
ncbi:nucleoside diphosphate-linked moiety X motif 17 isoform X1 [Lepisosteus oculatus]|uniref:nucleoside diphosphate-linked moiety X motif 17 isoform X1 n=1 Tax=Lepisosteus oculatus TaxID=7918 RepID=UPI0037223240